MSVCACVRACVRALRVSGVCRLPYCTHAYVYGVCMHMYIVSVRAYTYGVCMHVCCHAHAVMSTHVYGLRTCVCVHVYGVCACACVWRLCVRMFIGFVGAQVGFVRAHVYRVCGCAGVRMYMVFVGDAFADATGAGCWARLLVQNAGWGYGATISW